MARVAHCFLSMERHWRIALARNPVPIQIRCGTSPLPSRSRRACRDLAFQGQEQPVSHPVAGSSSNPVWLVEGCRANLMSGVLQVDPEDPADDLSQDLYEV